MKTFWLMSPLNPPYPFHPRLTNPTKGLPQSGQPPQFLPRRQRGLPEKRRIKDVRKVIAVSSAKGGVGKSTIAGTFPRLTLALWGEAM